MITWYLTYLNYVSHDFAIYLIVINQKYVCFFILKAFHTFGSANISSNSFKNDYDLPKHDGLQYK